jgi:hypothetical protein
MKPRAPRWITWLPVNLCLLLNALGMVLVALQWAREIGGPLGRPNDLAAPVPEEAVAFVCVQLVSAVLLVLSGRVADQERELAVLTTGVVVMLAIFQWGGQLVGASVGSAAGLSFALLIGVVAGIAAAVTVWSAIRLPSPREPQVLDVSSTPVRVSPWSDHTRIARLLAYGPAVALLPLTGVLLWTLASVGLAVALLVTLALVTMVVLQLAARVRVLVDAHGVTAHGFGVFTWIRIPTAALNRAHPVFDIDPIGDFGGWGLRTGFDGTRALITDAGAGVRIEQRSGEFVVITVEHPTEMAAAINTLVWHRDANLG